jgi:malate synthase
VTLDDGTRVDKKLVSTEIDAAMDRIAKTLGNAAIKKGRYDEARRLFERVALHDAFEEFLTIPAYEHVKTITKETASA